MALKDELSGFRFAFSGRFAFRYGPPPSRADATAFLQRFGAEVGPVGPKTTHTLVGTGGGRTAGIELDADGLRALFALDREALLAVFDDPDELERYRELVEWVEHVPLPHLDGADLRGKRVSGLDLRTVSLAGVDLTGGGLPDCSMGCCDGATFDGADLSNAYIESARGASFRGADLRGAVLDDDFSGAVLDGARLEGATFRCDLDGVDLTQLDLSGARFDRSLAGLSFRGLDLTRTELGSRLCGADFAHATLTLRTPRDLCDCDLTGTRFVDSCLDTADLRGAILDGTDFGTTRMELVRTGPPEGRGHVGPATRRLLETCADSNGSRVSVVSGEAVVHVEMRGLRAPGVPRLDWSLHGHDRRGTTHDAEAVADLCGWLSLGRVRLEGMHVGQFVGHSDTIPPRERARLFREAWAELLDARVDDEAPARVQAAHANHQEALDAAGEAQMLALVEEDPADLERWKVYADWLTAQGDVRGEIILREHREPDGKDRELLAARLVQAHAEAVLGELATLPGARYTYRNAFIDRIHLGATPNAAKICKVLRGHPATRFTRALESDTVVTKALDPMFALVAERRMTELILKHTRFADTARLVPLTHLRVLDLHGTQLRSAADLAGLTGLKRLGIGLTYVHDLTPLAALQDLVELDIARMHSRTPLSLELLLELPRLERLALTMTRVADFEVLRELHSLRWLELGWKQRLPGDLEAVLRDRGVELAQAYYS